MCKNIFQLKKIAYYLINFLESKNSNSSYKQLFIIIYINKLETIKVIIKKY